VSDDAADAPPTESRRSSRKRWIAIVTAIAVVVAALVVTAAVTHHSHHRDNLADSPVLQEPTTQPTTSTLAPKKAVPVVLPKPQPPPSDPYAATPIVQLGVLEIPKIHEVTPIYEGITLTVIDHGPGHWPGSAMPGQVGNTVFPGHRVTHTHPFLNLDMLSAGDQIVFHMPGWDYVYKVTGTQIVYPTDLAVTDPTPTPTVTLIACHPKHSAAQRIVVKGRLVASIRTSGA
jgi:sortase A